MNVPGVLSVANCQKTPCAVGKCCSQNGAKNGVCIADDAPCDTARGLPAKKYRDAQKQAIQSIQTENFQVRSKEGYTNGTCDCSHWEKAMFVVVIIFGLAFALLVINFLKKQA